MDLRDPTTADAERLRDLARSAMTASYALSPQQLDAIVEERFDEERLQAAFEAEEMIVLVAEDAIGEGDSTEDDGAETAIAGLVDATIEDDRGVVRWLFVDPEYRGRGVGTDLFEAATDALDDRGVTSVRATTFEANTEGGQFFERFGFERADQREVEIGEQSFVEHVYAESPATGDDHAEDGDAEDDASIDTDALPNVDERNGALVATTDDGRDVYLDREDELSGTDGPMIPAYEDESHDEQFGYYCGNCGSLDVTVDETERIECPECANARTAQSEDAYDDSYL